MKDKNGGCADVARVGHGNFARTIRRLALGVFMSSFHVLSTQAGAQIPGDGAVVTPRPAVGKTLTMSIIAPRGVERARADWSAFVDDLSATLRTPVTLVVGKTQADVVADMVQGRADLAWMGNAPALEVVEAGVGEVFASMVRLDGGSGYRSVILTQADGPIRTIQDLLDPKRALTFGAGDPKSTSGYVVPNYYVFAQNKVSPETVFKKIVTGNHQENALRVAAKEIDAGTCNDSELAVFSKRYPDQAKKIRVLWQSKEIPESPILWKRSLDKPLKNKIRSFFVTYGLKGGRETATLQKINGLSRFKPSTNRQLLVIADIEMFNARTQLDRDTTLTPEAKGLKQQAIVKRAVQLESSLRL